MLSEEILDALYQAAARSLQSAPCCGISDESLHQTSPGVPFTANILQIIAYLRNRGLIAAGAVMEKGPVKQTLLLAARSEDDLTAMFTELRDGVDAVFGNFSIIGRGNHDVVIDPK